MKIKKFEVWVGLFVVLGIAALLMLALQVSGLSNFYTGKHGYTVKAAFNNIGGLKVRSKVTISGVTVGRVIDISLEQNTYKEYQAIVSMSIDSNVQNIPQDSSAKILTSGLLGDNYVGIVSGQAQEYLHEGSVIELTSQALLLEDLISKFAVGGNSK
jgi:phospholipid/cholesterol/gamma-HCH transport system substrate-binding protein